MRRKQFIITCQVCGESGTGSMECLNWANFVSHKDPRVCAENLKHKIIKDKENK